VNAMPMSSDSSTTDVILKRINERILDKSIDIPMLPEVANRVIQTTQDPDSDASELANLIQSDQSLAAHVMRIANSAAYSPNASIVSLQQAITRLGMKVIAEIALAACVNSSLFKTPGYDGYIDYIFKYSLSSALWAKETARACRKNVEAAFLAGLLHDIGRPVAVQTILEIASELDMQLEEEAVLKLERKVQRLIGIQVLERWEMPESVRNVIEYFDNYQSPHNGQLQTTIVVAGTAIANHFTCPDFLEHCPSKEELLSHPAFAEINLYQDEVEQLLEKEEAVRATMETMNS
jgi:HD-like signal output (HDOD) protein